MTPADIDLVLQALASIQAKLDSMADANSAKPSCQAIDIARSFRSGTSALLALPPSFDGARAVVPVHEPPPRPSTATSHQPPSEPYLGPYGATAKPLPS